MTSESVREEVEAIRAREAKLNEEWSGDWWVDQRWTGCVWGYLREDDGDPTADACSVLEEPSRVTADYIAASRQAVPLLLGLLDQAVEHTERLLDSRSVFCTHTQPAKHPCGECSTCRARAFLASLTPEED